MRQPNPALAVLAALALAACQQAVDDSNIAIDDNINAAEAVESLPPSESGGAPENIGLDNRTTAVIPPQYVGRWGMVPGDCTSTRGDNKGLITIAANTIRFYESTATLKEQRPAIATAFAGFYGFTGEGQEWEKVVTLTRTGDTLKRADDEGSYTYTRC